MVGEGGGKVTPRLSSFFRSHSKFLNKFARNSRLLGRLPTSSLQRDILLFLEITSIVFFMNNAGRKAGF